VVDGFGLIIAAFSYNGQLTITATSDAKTMPDADKFARYIRDAANELEVLIKDSKKVKTAEAKKAKVNSKSTVFFSALKRYLKKETKMVATYKGIYHIEVDMGATSECWEINLTGKEAVVKKSKNLDPDTLIAIEDANLYAMYKGTLLFDELKIQRRIKMSGTVANKNKLTKLVKTFLDR
jgi:diacylglycerol O-acyltransferase